MVRFHVADHYEYRVHRGDGTARDIVINRYVNVHVYDARYHVCCGRILQPDEKNQARVPWLCTE